MKSDAPLLLEATGREVPATTLPHVRGPLGAAFAVWLLAACEAAPVQDTSTDDASPEDPWASLAVGLSQRPPNETCLGGSAPPEHLSEHPCFEGLEPAVSLVPYEVNAPLWSDGAVKQRFVALPDGAALAIGADGDLTLPAGGVAVKHFVLDGRARETRFLVRDDDGTPHAYTYAWRADGSEADLLLEGTTSGGWTVPSATECFECHLAVVGVSLGLELGQLHREATYGEVRASQLATLRAIGFLELAQAPGEVAVIATYDGATEESFRAYLHANCGGCHRPGGTGGGSLDLRYTRSLLSTGLCTATPEFGDPIGGGAPYVSPGNAEDSILHFRVATADSTWRMPPLGSQVVDPQGVALVAGWIASLETCQ